MDMGSPSNSSHACKISMLWNWYTIDACFLSSSWQITSHGMFAASCIGVAALVVAMEALRRFAREYDAFIVRQFRRSVAAGRSGVGRGGDECGSGSGSVTLMFRATPLQQLVRAVVHAVLFGLAYIVMLLAMYYNGYIIISIFVSAGIGKFLCDWLVVNVVVAAEDSAGGACGGRRAGREEGERLTPKMDTGVPQEASICCG